jgi:radical SAM superfamily enzyme YgiQ (UPF0313 family)
MKVALYVSRYPGESVQTPPGLQYLAGYLLSQGVVQEKELLFADSSEEIIAFQPDMVGIGSVSQSLNDAVRVATEVRRALPGCWTVLGGYHISALPDALPEVFHLGVLGEGEITFAEIAVLRHEGAELVPERLAAVAGICYRDGENGVRTTSKRAPIADLDKLPPPFRRLPYGQEWPYLFTARGCPYKCPYCASHSFWGSYRYHSAEYVVNEIDVLVRKFGVSNIYSVDDLFIAPKSRLLEIRRLLEERGLLGKVRFKGFIRINLVDEEVIRVLKELCFTEVRFGMETASERLLPQVKDQPFTIAQVERVIELCAQNGLPLSASFMFGIPGETAEDIHATRGFLRKHRGRLTVSGIYLMQPVPGSRYWDESLASGKVSPALDFSSLGLDLESPSFDWNQVLYLNGEALPLLRFKGIMKEIYREFGPPSQPRLLGHLYAALGFLLRSTNRLLGNIGFELRRVPRPSVVAPAGKQLGLRLYVGCGQDVREGFAGCDLRPLPNVSVVCQAWQVSRHCSEVKEIYCRHMLEHLTLPQVEATLTDWFTCLEAGGRVTLLVPNMDLHVEQWRRAVWDEASWEEIFSDARHSFAGFWGWQRECDQASLDRSGEAAFWDVHKCGFNAPFMRFLLTRAGFAVESCEVVEYVHLVAVATKPALGRAGAEISC